MTFSNEHLLIIACTLVLVTAVLVLAAAAYVLLAVQQITKTRSRQALEAQLAANPQLQEVYEMKRQAEPKSLWQLIDRKLTDAVPLAQEERILLHHNYDGIKELDNHLPPWWKWMFYVTVVYAVFYIGYYHFTAGAELQEQEYITEVETAEKALAEYKSKAAESIDETNVTLAAEKTELDLGKQIYADNCRACHGGAGEGGVGPNLTDEYWLHGGDIKAVFKTVKFGVPEKGMVSWKAKFKPAEIRAVSSYILSIQGTNPANAKEPQGERVAAARPEGQPANATEAKPTGEPTASADKPATAPAAVMATGL